MFEVKLAFKVTYQVIEDTMVSALEGGSNYWYDDLVEAKQTSTATNPSGRFYENIITNGFKIKDKEANEDHEVKPEDFHRALDTMATLYNRHFMDMVKEQGDAETGDVFLQCLVFNKLVYG